MKKIRSLLFVPAEEKRLVKIGQTNADAYIIDLEDSISVEDKEEALKRTEDFLSGNRIKNIFVRINRQQYRIELDRLKKFDVGYMLPKIESEDDYHQAADILNKRRVIALIETPRALLNANNIAAVPWITALAFGAEDFTVATSIRNGLDTLMVPKIMLSLAAKANGKEAYDTPCFFLQDDRSFENELQQAIDLGFDGKLAIHPKQIDGINHAFRHIDYQDAKHIIEAYEVSGKAVCEIDGMVYEKLHIDKLRKTVIDRMKK